MTEHRDQRTGHGRWCTIKSPCPGILWTNSSVVAFEAIPHEDADPASINAQIAATVDHLGADAAFDLLLSLIGQHEQCGDLATWTPDTPSHRPGTRPDIDITRAEIMARIDGSIQ